MRLVWDSEAKGLLNSGTVDYNASPYKLKDERFVHCVGFVNVDDLTQRFQFVGDEVYTHMKQFILDTATEMIGHNTISYDHLLLKAAIGLDYTIGVDGVSDTVGGKPIKITDTLVLSKTLNPDRPQHGIEYFGRLMGLEKIDWRAKAVELGLIEANAPRGTEFLVYHPEMAVYMTRDIDVNVKVYNWLMKEWGTWAWDNPYELEKAVAEIITRQEHRGFWFDKEKAIECVKDLDIKMEALRAIVEPLIPPKPLTKGALADVTPCNKQFKKNGEPICHILGFAKRHGGEFVQVDGKWTAELFGRRVELPMPSEPMFTHAPALITDTQHIKEWLVGLGWNVTQYKERDLSVDSKKKKLDKEKFDAAVEKWVEQTFASAFKEDRLEELGYSKTVSKEFLIRKLKGHDHIKRPLMVYTNPTLTVGMEKAIDPALEALSATFAYAKEISLFLTYRHRRNSILGGQVDPDDEDGMEKGWLSIDRVNDDHRIQTPADTCGAATSRFKHRICANVPRVTSEYGKEMRSLFGVDVEAGFLQLGSDIDSLEACVEAHYTFRYEGGKEYGKSLTAAKPNDCHTVLSLSITELLGRPFPRGTAKNVKYGCLPTDNTDVLTPSGWVRGEDVRTGDTVLGYNKNTRNNEWTTVTATQRYNDATVLAVGHTNWTIESTEDHRWYGEILKCYGKGHTGRKVWMPAILRTGEFVQTFNILNTAKNAGGGSDVLPHEAALVAWIIADGYYKWSEKSETTSASKGKRKGVVASIAQASHKFQAEIEDVLLANGIEYKTSKLNSLNSNTMKSYQLKCSQVREFIDRVVGNRDKKHEVNWTKWVIALTPEARSVFIHNFWLADGDSKGYLNESSLKIKQNRGNIADAVAVAGYLEGYNVTQRGGKCSTIRFQKERKHTTCQEFKVQGTRTTDVFCLTTDLDTFVIRQGGIMTITGNCSYNAQVRRVAKTVGCSLEEAQIIFDAFWAQAFPLKQLKEAMQAYWENPRLGNKKFLLGIDGRKLPIRSKGNVINTAFQSCGVICAKRAIVIHDRTLRDEGMIVDFWADDWKSTKGFCQFLINYHDESQSEVSRESVQFKKFDTEEDAKAFTDDSKRWSDVIHNDKGYFRAYSRAGELAADSVRLAGEYYNLNVPLSAGYIIGRNWAECH